MFNLSIKILILINLASKISGQSHTYMYTSHSCDDLRPKHDVEIAKIEQMQRKMNLEKESNKKPKAASLTGAEFAFLDLSAQAIMARNNNRAERDNKNITKRETNPPIALHVNNDMIDPDTAEPSKDEDFSDMNDYPVEQLPRAAAQTQNNATLVKTTTPKPTTTTTPPPPAKRVMGSSPLTLLTSEDKYRRLKHLTGKSFIENI